MQASNNHPESSTSQVGQARANTATSVAEVTDFLRRLQGKDPQEFLEVSSDNTLGRAIVQATVASVLLLMLLTVGPYLWGQIFPDAPPKGESAKQAEKAAPKEAPKSEAPAAETSAPAKTADSAKKPPVSKDALDKLGVTDTKTSSPKVNPLEKSADDLLKELDKK